MITGQKEMSASSRRGLSITFLGTAAFSSDQTHCEPVVAEEMMKGACFTQWFEGAIKKVMHYESRFPFNLECRHWRLGGSA